jgi:polyhydroxyalkanoate synthesis regulator phasin
MGFGDLMKKAVYLGVGLASLAGEKAGKTLEELREQAQKLAQEMVERGEMTAEEARRYADELVNKAQQNTANDTTDSQPKEPRRIEILTDDEEAAQSDKNNGNLDEMQQKVADLQAELRRLQNNQ